MRHLNREQCTCVNKNAPAWNVLFAPGQLALQCARNIILINQYSIVLSTRYSTVHVVSGPELLLTCPLLLLVSRSTCLSQICWSTWSSVYIARTFALALSLMYLAQWWSGLCDWFEFLPCGCMCMRKLPFHFVIQKMFMLLGEFEGWTEQQQHLYCTLLKKGHMPHVDSSVHEFHWLSRTIFKCWCGCYHGGSVRLRLVPALGSIAV